MNKRSDRNKNFKKAGSGGFQKIAEPAPKRDSVLESLLHSEHTVEIEKMAIGGDGVSRIDYQGKKLVVFVGKSAPGDVLKIKITSAEKNFLNGSILEIVKPGPNRRTAPCKYAPECGGCSWQQINEPEQLLQKQSLLKELFTKFLPTVPFVLNETVESPSLLNYRNRIQLKSQNGLLGYFKDKSHDLVDIDFCLIAEQAISDQISKLKSSLKKSDQLQKYELKINQNNNFETNKIGQKGEGLSFSQVNTGLNQLLVKAVLQLVTETKAKNITELYAGSGNFSFEMIANDPSLTIEAVEMNPDLTSAAVKKVAALSLQKKLTFFTTDCDSYIKRRPVSSELVLLDPPRAGCSDIVLEKLAKQRPNDIIYISCHPVSLVRDLQKLGLQQNNYEIKTLKIFNMFPQTDHFETLVWLTKSQT